MSANPTIKLQPGTPAPAFTLPDAEGKPVSLADYRGKNVIVYFYPQAATPGCTTEACDFRDNLASLQGSGYEVLGISPDAPGALAHFTGDFALTFPLLADEDHAVALAYGAWGEKLVHGEITEGHRPLHRGAGPRGQGETRAVPGQGPGPRRSAEGRTGRLTARIRGAPVG